MPATLERPEVDYYKPSPVKSWLSKPRNILKLSFAAFVLLIAVTGIRTYIRGVMLGY